MPGKSNKAAATKRFIMTSHLTLIWRANAGGNEDRQAMITDCRAVLQGFGAGSLTFESCRSPAFRMCHDLCDNLGGRLDIVGDAAYSEARQAAELDREFGHCRQGAGDQRHSDHHGAKAPFSSASISARRGMAGAVPARGAEDPPAPDPHPAAPLGSAPPGHR